MNEFRGCFQLVVAFYYLKTECSGYFFLWLESPVFKKLMYF